MSEKAKHPCGDCVWRGDTAGNCWRQVQRWPNVTEVTGKCDKYVSQSKSDEQMHAALRLARGE